MLDLTNCATLRLLLVKERGAEGEAGSGHVISWMV